MGLKVVERKKKPKLKRTQETEPYTFVTVSMDNQAKEDAEILIKASEIKQNHARYMAARKLIRGAINI